MMRAVPHQDARRERETDILQTSSVWNKIKAEEELLLKNMAAKDFVIPVQKFHSFLKTNPYPSKHKISYGKYFNEKTLEHFVSLQFNENLSKLSCVLDCANCGSPFPDIVHGMFKCKVVSCDLVFQNGTRSINAWHTQIGGDACSLPVENNTFDLITLHCAFEMFEGDDDIRFIREAKRILKPGGKLVILPLYLHEKYVILRDTETKRDPLPEIDEGAELIFLSNFFGIAFARIYSVDVFYERIVKNSAGLSLEIYKVQDLHEIGHDVYLQWIAVFTN